MPATTPTNGAANVFDDGDCIFGGGAADALEGRAGDDIIDGHRRFNAELCDGSPANSANCGTVSRPSRPAPSRAPSTRRPGDPPFDRAGNGLGQRVALFTGEQADYTVTTSHRQVLVVDNVGMDGTHIAERRAAAVPEQHPS